VKVSLIIATLFLSELSGMLSCLFLATAFDCHLVSTGPKSPRTGTIFSVALSADDKLVCAGGLDRVAWMWELETGKLIQHIKGHPNSILGVAFGKESKWILIGGYTAEMWDITSRKQSHELDIPGDTVSCVSVNADKNLLAVGCFEGVTRLWDTTSKMPKRLKSLEGHDGAVRSVDLSRDGKWLASGGVDRTVKMWNVESGKELVTLRGHTEPVIAVAVSSDTKWVVSGSHDNTARLWDLKTGQQLRIFEGHSRPVTSVAICPKNELLVTGGEDSKARLWEIGTGKQVGIFEGHTGYIRTVAITGNRKYVVTAGSDGTVRIWDLATQRQLRVLQP
jgi:WD40 repeat protein